MMIQCNLPAGNVSVWKHEGDKEQAEASTLTQCPTLTIQYVEGDFFMHYHIEMIYNGIAFEAPGGGGEIAQTLASLSIKRAIRVCARLDPLVSERWLSLCY